MQRKLYAWVVGRYGRPESYQNPQELVVAHRRELQLIAMRVLGISWPDFRKMLIAWMCGAEPNDEMELWAGARVVVGCAREGKKYSVLELAKTIA